MEIVFGTAIISCGIRPQLSRASQDHNIQWLKATRTWFLPQRAACYSGRERTMETFMYKMKIDLSENVRKQAIGLLNARLSDGVDLHYQAKQAHWNVKGPSFIALHELFDKVAD